MLDSAIHAGFPRKRARLSAEHDRGGTVGNQRNVVPQRIGAKTAVPAVPDGIGGSTESTRRALVK